MENSKRKMYIRLIALFALMSLALGVHSAVKSKRLFLLETQLELNNQSAANRLCESLDAISTDLKKSLYASTRDMLFKTGTSLYRDAATAKQCLSVLCENDDSAEEIFRFLSQVGSYTLALSEKKSLTDSDRSSLRALCEYSDSLCTYINGLLQDYSDGTVSFSVAESLPGEESLPEDFYSRIQSAPQALTDYPTLLYDGPFADGAGTGKGDFLKDKSEITSAEAAEKAAKLLGVSPHSLRSEKTVETPLKLYCFSLADSYISLTGRGGYVYTLLCDVTAGEAAISAKEAISRALKYLEKLGYKNMKESYYSIYDGIITVNFAYVQDSVICYSDLIKVSLRLDTGEVVGLDCSAFISNHHTRQTDAPCASVSEAASVLCPGLTVLSVRKAFIPEDSGKQVLCYEFHCRDASQELLIYISCSDSTQRDILLLLYQDGGMLTK